MHYVCKKLGNFLNFPAELSDVVQNCYLQEKFLQFFVAAISLTNPLTLMLIIFISLQNKGVTVSFNFPSREKNMKNLKKSLSLQQVKLNQTVFLLFIKSKFISIIAIMVDIYLKVKQKNFLAKTKSNGK